MNNITCCYNCPRRKVTIVDNHVKTCHMTCSEYIKQSKKRNEDLARIAEEKRFEYDRLRILRIIRHKTNKKGTRWQ